MNPHPFDHDYHSYGSPTVLSDHSPSRPISMNMQQQQQGKTVRPFVQAYVDEQPYYAGYDGSQSPGYYPQYEYAPQQEPMIQNTNYNVYDRNVPNENDAVRRESRHVPNERPSVPHTK